MLFHADTHWHGLMEETAGLETMNSHEAKEPTATPAHTSKVVKGLKEI